MAKEQQLYFVYKKIKKYGLSSSEKEVTGFIKVYIANVVAAMEYRISNFDRINNPILLLKTNKDYNELTLKQKKVFSLPYYGWEI